MIRECKVLSYNKFLNILVFDYEGKQIQMTAHLNSVKESVFVKYRDKKYEIVNKDEYEKYIRQTKKKVTRTKQNIKEFTQEDVSD